MTTRQEVSKSEFNLMNVKLFLTLASEHLVGTHPSVRREAKSPTWREAESPTRRITESPTRRVAENPKLKDHLEKFVLSTCFSVLGPFCKNILAPSVGSRDN